MPVVTTTVGGIPETIQSGKNGLLVQPFNSKQFSDAILRLLDNPAEAVEMGVKARQTVEEQLDWRIVVKDAMKVYEEVLT